MLHQDKAHWQKALVYSTEIEGSATGRIGEWAKRLRILAEQALERLTKTSIMDLRAETPIDVADLVRNLIKLNQLELRQQGIKANVIEYEGVPAIKMPREELWEVVQNLLSNSIRAISQARREKGEIEIAIYIEELKREELVIRVKDNGTGIRRDIIERIFDREFTGNAKSGGTGLGLFLARTIVQTYDGDIKVESNLGNGATFYVRLPTDWVRV
jgi:signal transduction histidine kinase